MLCARNEDSLRDRILASYPMSYTPNRRLFAIKIQVCLWPNVMPMQGK
jgi:hypothetical protein